MSTIITIIFILLVLGYAYNKKKKKKEKQPTVNVPKPVDNSPVSAHIAKWEKMKFASGGFLWKPVSESRGGRVAVLLPKSLSDEVITITAIVNGKLHNESVSVLRDAEGVPRRINADRYHFFGRYTGTQYKYAYITAGSIVRRVQKDGLRTE